MYETKKINTFTQIWEHYDHWRTHARAILGKAKYKHKKKNGFITIRYPQFITHRHAEAALMGVYSQRWTKNLLLLSIALYC